MSASWCRVKHFYLNQGTKLYRLRNSASYISSVPNLTRYSLCSLCNLQHARSYHRLHFNHVMINDRQFFILLPQTKPFSSKSGKSLDPEKTDERKTKKNEYDKFYYNAPTEKGGKKDVSGPLPPTYSPTYVEAAWYSWWVQQGYFTTEYKHPQQPKTDEKFIVCLPPPNVTGTLHLGHALTNSIQDAIVRWKRMKGIETVWIPGCDHAGIATQVVVEKQLKRDQDKSRFDVGREEFLKQVWKWKNEKGEKIFEQMKLLGSSLDWNRACFTMDQKLSKAVVESFVRMYDEGLIYRSNRLVNWSCALQSTISDIEVDIVPIEHRTSFKVPGYQDDVEFGVMTIFTYPIEDGGEITVSTTRLETMLGDVAVAVHPDDSRYKHLHGKCVIHPISGAKLPIISDDFVDMEFGTGAVKITPAHDYTDFEVGQRHKLPFRTVIDKTGSIVNTNSQFDGMKRFDCRRELAKVLQARGLLRGTESHSMTIPICSRSKDVIEPLLMDQWYVRCKDMANRAVQAVRDGELKLLPPVYEHVWFSYLENVRDWCISRQLWWGHRIPAYRASVKGDKEVNYEWVIARNEEEAYNKAATVLGTAKEHIVLRQDEDVLDTWFSSGIFPFSVHGWPDQTEDLQRYYPTSLLETGNDIIFFWVARMVMMGLQLTNQLPFKEVLFHGILRDSQGRKMSKSLGNVIDPIDVIYGICLEELHKKLESSNLNESEIQTARQGQKKEFPQGIPEAGADALRFSLCSFDFKAQDINMDITTVKSNRHFCNKIWQAFKFVQNNIGSDFTPSVSCDISDSIDQWILSRLCYMVQSCDQHFQIYNLHHVTKALHTFWLTEFCDVYLECIKPVLNDKTRDITPTKQTLFTCVDTFLRAASPFMPFLTEELYQRLHLHNANRAESITIATYPSINELPIRNKEMEEIMDIIRSASSHILSVSHDFNIKPKDMKATILIEDLCLHEKMKCESYHRAFIVTSKTSAITLVTDINDVPDGCSTYEITPGVLVYCQIRGVIDPAQEVEKLQEKIKLLETKLEKLGQKRRKKYQDNKVEQDKAEGLLQKKRHLEDRIKQMEDF